MGSVYSEIFTKTYDTIGSTRKCTQPNENLKKIYSILKTKHQPFTKRKSVVHKPNRKKIQLAQKQKLLSRTTTWVKFRY